MRLPRGLGAVGGLVATVLVALAGTAAALPGPKLEATRALGVQGTENAAFPLGSGPPLRQMRYADRKVLVYRIVVRNDSRLPVTVTGVEDGDTGRAHPLLRVVGLRPRDVRIAAGRAHELDILVLMTNCEFVSPRSGTVVDRLRVHVRRLDALPDTVTLRLPERLRTGSPRDEQCPHPEQDTRSPG